ncbi:sensor histidine kinase [Nocardia sp. CDC160]|uniref:sensor histidine kinase n=1 Tax=Nocardia sp. CDC160 TaxID=3112166 RepID=UPI002DC056CF|nr:histidine kinase [Nocardia sp. CDC160]MEC3917477.1 histidine kinase [Nocardia sp. CDC160]
MSFLPRYGGYLFLLLFTLSVWADGAGAVPTICAAAQAALLTLAQRRPGSRGPVLAVQPVVTYLPIVLLGRAEANLDCLLAATVLWCLPNRLRWFVFVAVAASSGFVHVGWHAVWTDHLYVDLNTVAIGLVVYSLLRLPRLVDRLERTQGDLAEATLARERLEVARRLRAALGDQLTGVGDLLRQARTELATEPPHARAVVEEATTATRRVIETVRETAAVHRDLEIRPADESPVSRLTPRLTLLALITSLVAWTVIKTLETERDSVATAVGGAVLSSLLMAQVLRPAWVQRLLPVQAAVTLLPLPWLGSAWSVWLILLAVAVLLSGRGIAAVLGMVGLVGLRAVYSAPDARWGWMILATEAILVVSGLCRFWQLSTQLNTSRIALAGTILQVERLRVARDIHDLLGMTLSVLALKGDLIAALVTRDPGRAEAEIDEALRIIAGAHTEARALVDDRAARSLRSELEAARRALADACRTVEVDYDEDLPELAGAVLAPVVREAVTNVLRHSTPTRVEIACRNRKGFLHLNMRNDGAADSTRTGGQGLHNMRTRVVDAGGLFETALTGGEFSLTARVPCP